MDEEAGHIYRQELADEYLEQIRKVRETLDQIEDLFLQYPDVPIQIYKDFEKQVVDMSRYYNEKFVEAWKKYDFHEMKIIQEKVIQEITEKSKTIM